MTAARRAARLCWSTLLAVTMACSPTPQEGGGIGGTGISASVTSGPITGFGSVFVSGQEYDTTGTRFTVDHRIDATQADLKRGMIVRVEATIEEDTVSHRILRRSADRITYEDTVQGPVQAVDPTGTSLTVLGQTILITDSTEMDDRIPASDLHRLVPGVDILAVSGFLSGDGQVVATRLARTVGAPEFEVKGTVRNHDAQAQSFQIGQLTVDYASPQISTLPSGDPPSWNGLAVHVLGTHFTPPASGLTGGRLRASSVHPETLGNQERTRAEIEGFVARVLSESRFTIGSVLVQHDAQTVFEGGTPADLGPGVRVEIDGLLSGNLLQARRVELTNRAKVEALVSAVTSADGRTGTLTLAGIPGTLVVVTAQTQFKGEGAPAQLGDVAVGDPIVVRGEPLGSELLATEITREVPTLKTVLQGPVSTIAPPRLTIFNTPIDTSALPDSAFRRADDTAVGRAAFFTALRPGSIVEIEGLRLGQTIQWNEAELQE